MELFTGTLVLLWVRGLPPPQALRIILFALLFRDVHRLDEISVLHEAQKILQLLYAKTTLEVERNNASTGGFRNLVCTSFVAIADLQMLIQVASEPQLVHRSSDCILYRLL